MPGKVHEPDTPEGHDDQLGACYPVYEIDLKDFEGFPTIVVAGPDREHLWLYAHDTTPTILRLHRWVVRFLLDALRELHEWFDQPPRQRPARMWTLRKENLSPECVLIAADQRAWLHVFAASSSVIRLNERTVQFLQYALAILPANYRGFPKPVRRWIGHPGCTPDDVRELCAALGRCEPDTTDPTEQHNDATGQE